MRSVILAAALALASCDAPQPDPRVEVHEAWVRLPPVSGRPAAAYFTLESNNDPTKLVSVSSPKVERIELHGTATEGGIARMRPVEDLVFPSNLKLEFAPGERHAMLFGVDPALKPGDSIPLTFTFEPAPSVTVQARVRAFGEGHGAH